MNLTFNEEIFKNCKNKEQYFQYIEELVWLGREVQDNGIMAFLKVKSGGMLQHMSGKQ